MICVGFSETREEKKVSGFLQVSEVLSKAKASVKGQVYIKSREGWKERERKH